MERFELDEGFQPYHPPFRLLPDAVPVRPPHGGGVDAVEALPDLTNEVGTPDPN